MEETLKLILDKLDAMQTDIAGLQQGQAATNDRLGGLEDGQERMDGNLAGLQQGQAATNDRLGRLEDGQERMDGNLAGLQQGQAATNDRLGRLEDGQERIDGKLAGLQQGQAGIRADMQEGFKQNREAIAEVVETVGKKIDHLESVTTDVKGATAQNAYELQVLKSKAQ